MQNLDISPTLVSVCNINPQSTSGHLELNSLEANVQLAGMLSSVQGRDASGNQSVVGGSSVLRHSVRWLSTAFMMAFLFTLGLSSTAMAEGPGPVTGWDALSKIQAGNKRYLSGNINWRPDPEARATLAGGQHPHTIVLSCSDSRVPPELIFDQGLGELFVVRVAGNVADANAIASIEYAIEHLGARLVLVMGHESCGAVKAALTTPKGKSVGTPSLDYLVGGIQKNLDGNVLFNKDDKTLVAPVKTNVAAVFRTLIAKSPVIRETIEKKELVMAQGIYSLASGEVSFFYAGTPEAEMEEEHHEVAHEPAPKKAPAHSSKKRAKVSTSHGSSAHAAPAAHAEPAHEEAAKAEAKPASHAASSTYVPPGH